ncbi:hypothetical protein EV384_1813 [Micromonospora kangleipakensis]|uniref:Uncharacterized protein n=1 Tax=Micromonospora kangleipakensis TaxID=1077942 RepID=A0A4Q8B6X3_9ACTN|nr:hypothetical protein [Micromonospora kangleipakensis]RZU73410.1 hypothetical protein EV384_1813 [Micromonospora kangleipakensis]
MLAVAGITGSGGSAASGADPASGFESETVACRIGSAGGRRRTFYAIVSDDEITSDVVDYQPHDLTFWIDLRRVT